jgi:hypothetical protein
MMSLTPGPDQIIHAVPHCLASRGGHLISNLTSCGSHCPNRLNSRVEWCVLNSFAVNYVPDVYEVDLLHDRQAT